MARLPITTPHRSYGRDDEATRLIEADGARQRALALLEWRRARDEGLRQAPEPEPVTPQTPPASYVPPMPLPEPADEAPAPDPDTIAERLKALDAAQLRSRECASRKIARRADRPQGGETAQAPDVPSETACRYDAVRRDDLSTSLMTRAAALAAVLTAPVIRVLVRYSTR